MSTGAALSARTRVDTPRALRKCFGLLPSDYASGARRRQGALPQAAQTHARRALVDGAWASRSPAKGSRHLPLRRAKQSTAIQDSSWKAQVRRCKRSRRLVARGKQAPQVVVASARALLGCMWAMAKQGPVTPAGPQTERQWPTHSEGL